MGEERLIEWSDKLSVGLQEIDEQHMVLVGLLNELHTAIKEKHGGDACIAILDRLVDYTRIHFAVEESLMRILEFPDYEEHKEEHEELLLEVRKLQGKIAVGSANISFELLHFLRMWLTNHILDSDMEYREHFISRGVKAKWAKDSWVKKLFGSH